MNFYSFDDIRAAGDCAAFAQAVYGATIHAGRCNAAWRGGDGADHVTIDREKWYDHVQKTGGGIIQLAAFKFNGDIQQAQAFLGEYYRLTPKIKSGAQPAPDSRYDELIRAGYKPIARYDYRDAAGALVHFVVRLQHPDKPGKEFTQGHVDPATGRERWGLKGVTTILYRLDVVAASPWCAIVEGEKSADALNAAGIPATTCCGGSKKWHDDLNAPLAGKDVAIFPDNDEPGRAHAEQVAESLYGTAKSIRIVPPAPGLTAKQGIDDYLTADPGRGAADIQALIAAAPPYIPASAVLAAATADASPTPDMLAAAKIANAVPFRNYIPQELESEGRSGRKRKEIVKEPRTHQALLDDLAKRFLGFPRMVGMSRMFDYDRDSGEIIDIDDSEKLLAWIGRRSKHNPDWARGDAMITPRQFRASVMATCRRYESISLTPDWPARQDVFYAHGPLPAPCPNGSRFNAFCNLFLPASDIDAMLIRAFACCPLWYIPGLPRPSWIIDSQDGQGSGKSNLVELVSELYGHAPIKTSKQELSQNLQQITKRCLSHSGRDARMLLVDNVTGNFDSPEFADMVTSKHITGMAPYGHGEETRPNNLVYCITANSATVGTDIADRSIYIHVRKPTPAELAGWKERIQGYIRNHRMEIFADIIQMLSKHKPFPGVLPQTRFPEFDLLVLQPCCGTPELLEYVYNHIVGARADSNIEEDMARMISETFTANIAAALRSEIPRPVFIRSELVNSWGRRAIDDTYEYKGKPIQLIRNLAKMRLLPQVDRKITRWPTNADTRFSGIAWGFTDTTEQATILGRDHENNITQVVM